MVFYSLQTAMEIMGLVGVIVNVALIGLSGQVDRMFPNITTNQTILLIILLEVRCCICNPLRRSRTTARDLVRGCAIFSHVFRFYDIGHLCPKQLTARASATIT